MIQHEIKIIGLHQFETYVRSFPEITKQAAMMAINDAARKGRSLAKDAIMDQVNFPNGYLGNEKSGRLRINNFANERNLFASIKGRFDPTSLVRFVQNQSTLMRKGSSDGKIVGRGSARVSVKPGSTTIIDRAYLMRLKNGNVGFAYRPGKGGMTNTRAAKPIGSGWYLLYGPSVNQVFNTVRDDIAPTIANTLSSEFDRQFRRLSNGR